MRGIVSESERDGEQNEYTSKPRTPENFGGFQNYPRITNGDYGRAAPGGNQAVLPAETICHPNLDDAGIVSHSGKTTT
jgi:hypothetical protein